MSKEKETLKDRNCAMAAWLQALTHGLQDYLLEPLTVGQAEELLKVQFGIDKQTANRVVVIAAIEPQEELNPAMSGKMPKPSPWRQR